MSGHARILSAEAPLLLGSASPRRRELLASVGLPIVTVAPRVDEALTASESPAAYLDRIVSAKMSAALAAATGRGDIRYGAVLVADTVVDLDGEIVDKPESAAEARVAIARLAGRTHAVSTRFALGAKAPARGAVDVVHAETVLTRVTMRALSPREIDAYVASRDGFDKAGGYGIQGGAAGFVTRIDGSYTSVVGLPLAEVFVALVRAGLWE